MNITIMREQLPTIFKAALIFGLCVQTTNALENLCFPRHNYEEDFAFSSIQSKIIFVPWNVQLDKESVMNHAYICLIPQITMSNNIYTATYDFMIQKDLSEFYDITIILSEKTLSISLGTPTGNHDEFELYQNERKPSFLKYVSPLTQSHEQKLTEKKSNLAEKVNPFEFFFEKNESNEIKLKLNLTSDSQEEFLCAQRMALQNKPKDDGCQIF